MENEKEIVVLLRRNSDGLTITDIVKKSRFSRSTIRTILARLEGGHKVKVKTIGMAKLYSLK